MTSILLIEDDTDINETTEELLEIAGFEVFTANNGQLGLELVHTKSPDVILCDIWMPEKSGYEVLDHLKSNPKTSGIPFIFFSARTEPRDIRKGLAMGAEGYISKPFTEEELLGTIKRVLA